MQPTHDRATKYSLAVQRYMALHGHATNHQLLVSLRKEFPDLSATTVHRITSRMLDRGELQLAPNAQGNVMRFDANLEPHDHFMCERCDLLRDARFDDAVRPVIEAALGDECSISGSLTVSGICKRCRSATHS